MNGTSATPLPKRQISQEEVVRSEVFTADLLEIQALCYVDDVSKDTNAFIFSVA
jgi:hypothetical protein